MSKLLIFNERWCSGGVESLWANILAYSPESALEIVIAVWQKETNIYDSLLEKKNIRFIEIGNKFIKNPIRRDILILKSLKKCFNQEKADIIHINVCNAIGLKYAKIARKAGCRHVVVHSHNTMIEHDRFKIKLAMHHVMRFLYAKQSVYRIACSTEAGEFLFGKKKNFEILKNGVDLARFTFNEQVYKVMREKYHLSDDDFVVCHVGRFAKQKNHTYLIRLFAEIVRQRMNSYLFLAGEGPELNAIKDLVRELKLENKIYFLGTVTQVENLYFMSDAFVLPSLHEGLPVVAVEAQATGLNCYLSDTISREAGITKMCRFFSLSEDLGNIAQNIVAGAPLKDRKSAVLEISDNGYSIKESSRKLFEFYRQILD